MSISTNLSVTSRGAQYNGKISNIRRLSKQISHTNQLFFLSFTSRPFYASSWRDPSACGIPAIVPVNAVYSGILFNWKNKTCKTDDCFDYLKLQSSCLEIVPFGVWKKTLF